MRILSTLILATSLVSFSTMAEVMKRADESACDALKSSPDDYTLCLERAQLLGDDGAALKGMEACESLKSSPDDYTLCLERAQAYGDDSVGARGVRSREIKEASGKTAENRAGTRGLRSIKENNAHADSKKATGVEHKDIFSNCELSDDSKNIACPFGNFKKSPGVNDDFRNIIKKDHNFHSRHKDKIKHHKGTNQ